jgi:hypothetical protein
MWSNARAEVPAFNIVQLPMLPHSRPNEVSLEIRAASSRKRKESRRAIENADPLLPKNKKAKPSAENKWARQDTEVPTHSSPSTRKSSVDIEEVAKDGDSVASNPHPVDQAQIHELTDRSDDGDNEAPAVIDIDDEKPEESAESELSRPTTVLCHHQPKCIHRTTFKGLERTRLCFFQARAHH